MDEIGMMRKPKVRNMLPRWVEVWLWVSTVLCILDIFYTMMRPATLRGGSLGKIYELWNVYSDIDLRYADSNDLVTMATGRVMIIEMVMNIAALIMAHRGSRHAVLTAFTTSAFVFWKTLFYLTLYVKTPPGSPSYLKEDAGFWSTLLIFWIPDGVWVVLPLGVMCVLWNRLAGTAPSPYLTCADRI